MGKIGIAYTVHNRNDIAIENIAKTKKLLPKGAVLIVVDDGSLVPFEGASFRFDENVGIPVAKNKCIEMLYEEGCTHFFLFDDDTYAKAKNWWKPYVENSQPHLMFTFDTLKDGRPNGNRKIISKNGLVQYLNPCGCMLYFTKEVVDTVGGFDTNFKQYAYEHVNFSLRVYNAGLTASPYQDVLHSLELFHSMDWAVEVKTSVQKNRHSLLFQNKKYFDQQRKSKDFKPFRPLEDVFITTLFTQMVDPQRKEKWGGDEGVLEDLTKSLNGKKLIVLSDSIEGSDGNTHYVLVKTTVDNPYWQRWLSIKEHLENHMYGKVFIVDGTDVKLMRDPFPHLSPGKLYLGDEPQIIRNKWLMTHHPHVIYKPMYEIGANWRLLNAGLCGGLFDTVKSFVDRMSIHYDQHGYKDYTDMAGFNFVAYRDFKGSIVHGKQVNNTFKSYADNGICWLMHK